MNHLREHYVLVNYSMANIFVQNVSGFHTRKISFGKKALPSLQPGNLYEPARLDMVNRLVESYEAYPECLGANFSHYFVR